ncbi:protein kinase family protein [Allobranchiibius sp. GilTou73]|uniref:protein kinase family protein n=1 Tax=Allobranchiibius sp. GilTou73 TaxID=2904523 RepID=UPI001F2D1D76|nr:protein kinase family protein [Allobranchiibius sp. GilTou73]UIJ35585.1 protein kinase family protein [Allobranchiibius sp. GilTou73]
MQHSSEGDALAGRYELTSSVAVSGARRQWHAVDRTLARDVTAITFPADDPHAEAALDSARRAAGVDDLHLLRILDVGTEDGTSYVVTERVHDAESLVDLLRFQTLPAEEARRIVGEAATGLHTAAARGLHHLMLTPHDIVRSRDGAITVLGVATDGALAGLDDVPPSVASRTDTKDLVRILYAALTGRWPGAAAVPGLPSATGSSGGSASGSDEGSSDRPVPVPAPSTLVTRVPSDLDSLCLEVLVEDGGPRTPGELARLLSPWSAERVHGVGGRDVALADEEELAAAPAPHRGAATRYFDDADRPTRRRDPDETRQHAVGALPADMSVRDPSLVDLEPPAPGLPSGYDEPDRRSSGLALGIVAVLLILTLVVAVYGLRGIGSSGASGATSTKSPTSTTSSAPSSTTTSTVASGTPIKPVSITSYDPDGNGDEHNELARRAIDGDNNTMWVTHIYRTDTFGSLKNGVGLLLDLGSSKQVGSVSINVIGNPTTIEVFVTNKKTIVGGTPIGTLTNGSGEQTVRGTPRTGRYVIVWITHLSQYSGGLYRDQIAEVKVFS